MKKKIGLTTPRRTFLYTTVSADYRVTVYRSIESVIASEFSSGNWFLDEEEAIPCDTKSLQAALGREERIRERMVEATQGGHENE